MADSFLGMVEAWLSPDQVPAGRGYGNVPPAQAPAVALSPADRKLRIECEIMMIAPRFADRGGVDFDEANGDWMRIRRFALPERWQDRWAQLLIIFPQTYPVSPPLGFYLDKQFPLASGGGDPHLTGFGAHGAPDLLAAGWHWYCVQPLAAADGGWNPRADYRVPDNLWTILSLVRDVLSNDE